MHEVTQAQVEKCLAHVSVELDGCWWWLGAVTPQGYGRVPLGRRQSYVYAHRLTYMAFVGDISDGMELDHLCRVRWCCNPDHLEAVSHAENMRRGLGIASTNAAKTHCQHGHEFTPKNTRIRFTAEGLESRICRACRRAA